MSTQPIDFENPALNRIVPGASDHGITVTVLEDGRFQRADTGEILINQAAFEEFAGEMLGPAVAQQRTAPAATPGRSGDWHEAWYGNSHYSDRAAEAELRQVPRHIPSERGFMDTVGDIFGWLLGPAATFGAGYGLASAAGADNPLAIGGAAAGGYAFSSLGGFGSIFSGLSGIFGGGGGGGFLSNLFNLGGGYTQPSVANGFRHPNGMMDMNSAVRHTVYANQGLPTPTIMAGGGNPFQSILTNIFA